MKKRIYRRTLLIVGTLVLTVYALAPSYRVFVAPPTAAVAEDVKRRALNLGLDLQGGIHVVLEVDPRGLDADAQRDVVDRVIEVLQNRVDQFGVTEPIIHKEGDLRIVVELPGVKDAERAKALIGQTARLEFRMLESQTERSRIVDRISTQMTPPKGVASVDGEAESSFSRLLMPDGQDLVVRSGDVDEVKAILARPEVAALIPSAVEFLWGSDVREESFVPVYLVRRKPEMTGESVQDATATRGASFEYANQPIVNFTTTSAGVDVFSRVTGRHIGDRMAIVLDGKVKSAPTIQAKIRDGRSIITGSGTMEEAKDLAIVLRAGALPVDVSIVEDRTVGPSLGRDSVAAGKLAAIVGFAAVAGFMILYYGFGGAVADLALVLNIGFILALLAAFHGTLTLPGIAGIVLTMGMAVDANVLIFERIREERRAGRTAREALRAGYARAFVTIVDSNLTTVITAVVLYEFGTGPIKGFALTLMIGLAASMFTAVFVTRTVFDALLHWKPEAALRLGRARIFGNPAYDLIGRRRLAYALSAAVIGVGLGAAVVKGGYRLGIDFTGGTLVEYHFERPVEVQDLRDALGAVPVDGAMLDLRGSEIKQLGGDPRDMLVRVKESAAGGKTAQAIHGVLSDRFQDRIGPREDWIRRQEAVGPKIGTEMKGDAVKAIVVSLVLLLLYVWWRFKHVEFGVGAVIALFHDVMVTLGAFALTDREISLSVVAALLTIVGFSLNDTIVIYDRVRENLAQRRGEGLTDLLNRSNNECLSRTVITSGTALLSVLAILILGGEVIHDFAFAMAVGFVAGTYSTIYVATPFVLEWQAVAERRRRASSKAALSHT